MEGNRYEVDLEPAVTGPDGKVVKPARTVVLRELSGEEFETVLAQTPEATEWAIAMNGLRRSIESDGSDKLDYQKLMGPLLARRFKPKFLLMLRQAWSELHLLGEEDLKRVRGMRVVAG